MEATKKRSSADRFFIPEYFRITLRGGNLTTARFHLRDNGLVLAVVGDKEGRDRSVSNFLAYDLKRQAAEQLPSYTITFGYSFFFLSDVAKLDHVMVQ